MPDGGHQAALPPLRRDAVAWVLAALTWALTGLHAAPAGSWLDSGELIAAARTFGIIHPPGHPAWLSQAGLAEWLPLGPHALRVAWLSGLWAGISVLLVVRMAREVLRDTRLSAAATDAWAASAGLTLLASGSLWQVAVRAEVYTLALASNLWLLLESLRAGRAVAQGQQGNPRPHLAAACLALSVGLLNHHYVALFTLPAAMVAAWPALRAVVARQPRLALAMVLAAAWLGLGYLLLVARAHAGVELRWGDPTTLRGLWDTVTARHFQRSVTEASAPLADNLMVLLAMVTTGGGIILPMVGLAGVGMGAVLRTRNAAVVALALVGGLLTKALMQIDTHNPDDHGYVLLTAAALALGVAQLGKLLTRIPPRWIQPIARVAMTAAVLSCGVQAWALHRDPATSLSGLRAPETLDSLARRAVAPAALVLPNYYGIQYNEAAFRLAEGRRPDWVVSHLSFRGGDTDGGRAYQAWFERAHPQLAVLAQGARHFGRPPIGNIMQLAETQPVYAEADPANRIPTPYWGFDGVFSRLLTEPERALDYDVGAWQQRQQRLWQRRDQRLTTADLADHPTRMVLLWQHALQAAHALRRGWRDIARAELDAARAIAPQDRQVAHLTARLGQLDAAWQRGDDRAYAALWQQWTPLDIESLLSPDGGAADASPP